eukprot:gene21470-27808_t
MEIVDDHTVSSGDNTSIEDLYNEDEYDTSKYDDLNDGMPYENIENKIYAKRISEFDNKKLIEMIEFSFHISNQALVETLLACLIEYDKYLQDTENIDDLKMKSALSIAGYVYGNSIERINRTQEERLAFEATFLDLCSRRKELMQIFSISQDDFLKTYPECHPNLVGLDEFDKLYQFRNLMKLAMHLIPPLHNKNHLLDLVTRLVEGKDVKHITGTGATKATRLRVNIILKEGNLVVPKRPPRKGSSGHKLTSHKTHHNKQKSSAIKHRGRPRKQKLETQSQNYDSIMSKKYKFKSEITPMMKPLETPVDINNIESSSNESIINIMNQYSILPAREPSYNILDTNYPCTPTTANTYQWGPTDPLSVDIPLTRTASSEWLNMYKSKNIDTLDSEMINDIDNDNDLPLKELLRQTSLFRGISK